MASQEPKSRNDNKIVIRTAKVVPLGNVDTTPETITLSDRDWDAFAAALEHPPKPNAARKSLMQEFGPWQDGATGPTSEKS